MQGGGRVMSRAYAMTRRMGFPLTWGANLFRMAAVVNFSTYPPVTTPLLLRGTKFMYTSDNEIKTLFCVHFASVHW